MTRRLIIAVVSIAVIATVILLVKSFPTTPTSLKQNLYQKKFTDYPYELVSLDVIILYETETDGTWRSYWRSSWGIPSAEYNITVLVKPKYINESMISNVNIIDWVIGADDPIAQSWSYYPSQAAPVDWGTNLMDFWSNRSAFCVVSKICIPMATGSSGFPRESTNINYHFSIRTIQTNGTRFIFILDDFFLIPISE